MVYSLTHYSMQQTENLQTKTHEPFTYKGFEVERKITWDQQRETAYVATNWNHTVISPKRKWVKLTIDKYYDQ